MAWHPVPAGAWGSLFPEHLRHRFPVGLSWTFTVQILPRAADGPRGQRDTPAGSRGCGGQASSHRGRTRGGLGGRPCRPFQTHDVQSWELSSRGVRAGQPGGSHDTHVVRGPAGSTPKPTGQADTEPRALHRFLEGPRLPRDLVLLETKMAVGSPFNVEGAVPVLSAKPPVAGGGGPWARAWGLSALWKLAQASPEGRA